MSVQPTQHQPSTQQEATASNKPQSFAFFQEAVKGGAVGAFVVMFVTPGIYFANMKILKQPPNIRDCMRGVFLSAFTVVPQATLQMSIRDCILRALYPQLIESQRPSLLHDMYCSAVAGGVSAIATVPVELIVQQVQKNQQMRAQNVVGLALKAGGARRLWTGGLALGLREALWACAYLSASNTVASVYKRHMQNQKWAEIMGAATTGACVGALTNPLNVLRALKQDQFLRLTVESYWKIIAREGVRALFRGVQYRMPGVAVACVLMKEGKKWIDSY